MNDWHNLKIKGIAGIEKCVAEFNVSELKKTPWAKFKVKIYEDSNGSFTGYTNLMIKNATGDASAGVGYGNTVEEALENTVLYFLKMLDEKETWMEEEFECANPYEF